VTAPRATAQPGNGYALSGFDDAGPAREEISYWDAADGNYWDDYLYRDYYLDYNWEEQENPCHNAYYGRRRWVSRNILASDLGITAKAGSDGRFHLAVTDLVSARPAANVELELMNFQQQVLASARTGSDGMAEIEVSGRPFMLAARKGEQRGYLRLDDGSSLSLSRFDVSGNIVQEGVKGYIYGERGVWRPGDSLFLSFILEDTRDVLPDGHPVIFELLNPRRQVVERMVRTSGVNGFYTFATAPMPMLPPATGAAVVKVGDNAFSRNLRIETVRPNRMKIDLGFDTRRDYLQKGTVRGSVGVNWLHGAPASLSRVNVTATLRRMYTAFEGYPGFIFDDPAKEFQAEEVIIFDGRLDEGGKAGFSTIFATGNTAPGKLNASFVTRAFEAGGNFSTDRFTMQYSPYEIYTGIMIPGSESAGPGRMLETGTDYRFEVVTIDPGGSPVSGMRSRSRFSGFSGDGGGMQEMKILPPIPALPGIHRCFQKLSLPGAGKVNFHSWSMKPTGADIL
jgi:alpha-2-macroglobulin